ncbi:cache domain-containing protein [Spirochaetia bacterium 38H-sp]|uniref:Cache domain-containing protein n=1 Tax=Rarispira pelagica TaxID=3141764 RepID=A0ABU9UC81_9SPIR
MAPLKLLIIRSSITRKMLLPIAGFLILFFIIGLIVIDLTTERAGREYLQQLEQLVSSSIKAELEDMLTTTQNIAYINSAYVEENIDEPKVFYNEIIELFKKELDINRNISIIAVGLKNGFYVEAQRLQDNSIRCAIREKGDDKDLVFFRYNMGIRENTGEIVENYDPRTRPWYKAVKNSISPRWSQPYTLASSGTPAIAISMPIKEGEGVTTVTLELSFISFVVKNAINNHNTELLLTDKDNRILASSIPLPKNIMLKRAEELSQYEYVPPRAILFTDAISLTEEKQKQINDKILSMSNLTANNLYLKLYFITDRNSLLSPFIIIKNSSIGNLVGFLITSFILMIITERKIKSRFKKLTEYTSITGIGESIPQGLVEMTADPDEIGQLARALLAFRRTISEQQERILFDLEEKSRMIREIDHRVKNNIQMMSSIMALEAESYEKETKDVILFIRKLILTMGIVHDIAYEQPRLSSIELSGYFASVIHLFEDRLNPNDKGIEYKSNVNINMDMPMLIPHGIILAYFLGKIKKDTTNSSQIYITLNQLEESFSLDIRCTNIRKDNNLDSILDSALITGVLSQLSAKLEEHTINNSEVYLKIRFRQHK